MTKFELELELYGVEISATFVASVTDAVLDEVRQWQNRPLEALYPIVYVDCLVVKVRENQRIINRALYLALGMWLGLTGLPEAIETLYPHTRVQLDCANFVVA